MSDEIRSRPWRRGAALAAPPAPTPAVSSEAVDPELGRRRWLILAVIGVAQLMVVLDATIVNIALPSAQRALGFSTTDRQWVITAYALAFGGLLVVTAPGLHRHWCSWGSESAASSRRPSASARPAPAQPTLAWPPP
jgi:MFS family permease